MLLQRLALVAGMGVVLALPPLNAEPGTRELSPTQEAELKKLREQLWDEGYSEEDINRAVAQAKTRMASGAASSGKGPDSGGSRLQECEERLRCILSDAVEREILPKERADKVEAEFQRAKQNAKDLDRFVDEVRKNVVNTLSPDIWKEWMMKSADGKGGMGVVELLQLRKARAKDLLDARKACREKKLDRHHMLGEMRRQFPTFPEAAFEVSDDFLKNGPSSAGKAPAEPAGGKGQSGSEGSFSEDDLDDIADEMLMEEFGR